MGGGILIRYSTNEHHAQADDQLCDRASIRVRRIKNGDAFFGRGFQIDLIYADTKRSDRYELVGSLEDGVGSVRATVKPATWATLSARAERFAYTSTEASLASSVMPTRLTLDANFSTPSGWSGQAEWQLERRDGRPRIVQLNYRLDPTS
jgi:hypothetical protein